ncbi:MAG TPA: DUF1573 domain-containing protein [Anaerolineales bacterium]
MSQKYGKQKSRRKRGNPPVPILLGVGGLLLIAAIFLSLKGGGSGSKVAIDVKGAPSLKADKENIDLGNVKLGKTVEVSFQISNTGDQPLRLTEAPYVEVVEGC